jgi:hypothetical protein
LVGGFVLGFGRFTACGGDELSGKRIGEEADSIVAL